MNKIRDGEISLNEANLNKIKIRHGRNKKGAKKTFIKRK